MKLTAEVFGVIFLLVIWLAALMISPVIGGLYGPWWGVLAAICIFLLWGAVLPTSCMNGGLGFSLMAITLFMNIIGMSIVAIIDLLRSFFD